MATLSPQTLAEDGITPTLAAASAGGDQFENTSAEIVVVKNASGAGITVTAHAQNTTKDVPGYGTMTKANGGGAVAAGATAYFGPFPTKAFNNASGRISLSYSSTTSVTVGVLRKRDFPVT